MDEHYPHISMVNSSTNQSCLICGSSALGMNFGVLTCAPCKAFFRRNARRKDLLDSPCRHRHITLTIHENVFLRQRLSRYLQIRRCASCRLRRCFDVGMKEELVRTEQENQRYRELVELNRQRRETIKQQWHEIEQLSIPQCITLISMLQQFEWRHLSNVVSSYDTNCVKQFIEKRSKIIFNQKECPNGDPIVVAQPTTITTSIAASFSSFFQSLPAFQSLSRATQSYLCKINIRPLIFPNIYELNQSCFSETWQFESYTATWKLMCGPELYKEFQYVERLEGECLIADPVVTRLWMVTLFFSTPLIYHNDENVTTPLLKKKPLLVNIQNAYATLLWKYLLSRHQENDAVRIFSNLIRTYIKMQTVGQQIYAYLRSQQELVKTHEALQKVLILNDADEDEEKTSMEA